MGRRRDGALPRARLWLLAGLSGVINATIAFDQVVHNTLWIVGHFHQMALLNIGFVVFAGIYSCSRTTSGSRSTASRSAKWHIWLTFIGVTVNSAFWLWQGLEGAPRRFAVLPSGYEASTRAALPFVALIVLAQADLRRQHVADPDGCRAAARSPEGRRNAHGGRGRDHDDRGLPGTRRRGGGLLPGRGTASSQTKTVTVQGSGGTAPSVNAQGKQVFASAGCGGCHTLKDAGSDGTIGPNLDQAKPTKGLVVSRVTNGLGGMPSFKGQLSDVQIQAVAAYVSSVAR